MQSNRETSGLDVMATKLPDVGVLIEAQRAATENASRMVNAACHYTLSINRAWLDLWDSRLSEYIELPKRLIDAQTDFLEQAFDHYQESLQKFGSLAAKAKDDAEEAVSEAQHEGERVVRRFQSDAKEAWSGRPKENPMRSASEESREPEQQRSAH
jgi:hypothetical protein